MDMYKQTTRKRITEQKSIIATIIKKIWLEQKGYGYNKLCALLKMRKHCWLSLN